jgi:seryl-tRNA synthetase
MLDINDFIVRRGGDPDTIRESQRRQGASVELVDQVVALFEEYTQGKQHDVSQL